MCTRTEKVMASHRIMNIAVVNTTIYWQQFHTLRPTADSCKIILAVCTTVKCSDITQPTLIHLTVIHCNVH